MTKELRQYSEAKIVFSTNGAETVEQPQAKKKKKNQMNLNTDITLHKN